MSEISTGEEIAECVLAQYEIESHSVKFLQHSGAMTYHVRDDNGCGYLLRVYAPISEFIADRWVRPKHIRSEMMWLSFLREEGSISVQEPLKTKEGDWIAMLGRRFRKTDSLRPSALD